MATAEGQIDNSIEIVTPENIAFRYRAAGPFRRFLAYLIDVSLQVALFTVLTVAGMAVLAILGLAPLGLGLTLVLWFLLHWFYGAVLEVLWNGQTVGKRLLEIRVVTVDGQPINGLQAVLRNLLRAVDLQPVAFGMVGLAAASMNDRFQRLGDLACGTMVVMEERSWLFGAQIQRMTEPEALRLAGEIPANYQVSRSLARALASYVQRRLLFSPARRAEIARHLGEPLRLQFGLPGSTRTDLLLCALYHRAFVADDAGAVARSPFRAVSGHGTGEAAPIPRQAVVVPPRPVPGNSLGSVQEQPTLQASGGRSLE